jgi:Predicted UDP-glucose 6-dehydrogenase
VDSVDICVDCCYNIAACDKSERTKMNITIAGYGFVGRAHEAVLKNKFTVNIYDPPLGYTDIVAPNGVIVCVSTPPMDDGSCNVNNVADVIGLIAADVPVLIKSTISLEGWQALKELFPDHKLAFSPEFLRAATAVEDFLATKEIYMGGDEIGFWHAVFRVAFDDDEFITHHALAEELILAKYFRNSFLASKVAFFNQVYDLCVATGIEYEIVRHVITTDQRIGYGHTEVTSERGFGGHCFPKDVQAIIRTAEKIM